MAKARRFTIRSLKPRDMKDLVEAYYSYYDDAKKDPGFGLMLLRKKPPYAEERKWFRKVRESIRKGNTIASVAVVDGKVVGMCDVSTRMPGSPASHIGSLGIAIRAGYRDTGIGDALVKDLIRRSRGRYEILKLEVFRNNGRARHLYAKNGFRRYGLLKNGIKRGSRYYDEELMYLNLKKGLKG